MAADDRFAALEPPRRHEAGRIEIRGGPLDAATVAALLADLTGNGGPVGGFGVWAGSRRRHRVRRRAEVLGVPFLLLDYGLLRAPRWPRRPRPLLSVTAATISGPASAADRLSADRVLASRDWTTPALIERAAAVRAEVVARRVGGAWWHAGVLPAGAGRAVIACEHPVTAEIPRRMIAAALAEYPAAHVLVLIASEPGRKELLDEAAAQGCAVASAPFDGWAAIECAERVYTAGGEIGFLALLAGRDVHSFGDAFYTGWGVTTDHRQRTKRPFPRSVDEIFAGACLVATRYRDPFGSRAVAIEEILSILADWRRTEFANREVAVCAGMSFWKRRRVADFFASTAKPPVFRRTASGALAAARRRAGRAVAVWASRMPEGLVERAAQDGVPLIRVEDGFVRSVGLGSDFMPAASLVLDRRGLYCDPNVESDLEILLREADFDPALIERARRLMANLVTRGITKYNLGAAPPPIEAPSGKRRILVPGQVEDDLSVRLGGGGIRGNLDLLARVRRADPDAFILYKPHPDVEAGHRQGAVADDAALQFADRLVRGVSTAALFDEIDELHTLTSLAGFEALLRGRRVVVYGRPFYAGWGLTADLGGLDRGRRLSLEELVAGALILYPRYLDPVTRLPCPPEVVIERLENAALWRPGTLVAARRIQGMLARRWRALPGRAPAGDSIKSA